MRRIHLVWRQRLCAAVIKAGRVDSRSRLHTKVTHVQMCFTKWTYCLEAALNQRGGSPSPFLNQRTALPWWPTCPLFSRVTYGYHTAVKNTATLLSPLGPFGSNASVNSTQPFRSGRRGGSAVTEKEKCEVIISVDLSLPLTSEGNGKHTVMEKCKESN